MPGTEFKLFESKSEENLVLMEYHNRMTHPFRYSLDVVDAQGKARGMWLLEGSAIESQVLKTVQCIQEQRSQEEIIHELTQLQLALIKNGGISSLEIADKMVDIFKQNHSAIPSVLETLNGLQKQHQEESEKRNRHAEEKTAFHAKESTAFEAKKRKREAEEKPAFAVKKSKSSTNSFAVAIVQNSGLYRQANEGRSNYAALSSLINHLIAALRSVLANTSSLRMRM